MNQRKNPNKLILYIGVTLLTAGIAIRVFSDLLIIAIPLVIIGALCKMYYLQKRISLGGYKPGFELIFLILGLSLFLPAIYIKTIPDYFNPLFLIIPGLILKGVFVVLFIRKLKK